jgi:hypothetical protein
LVYNDKLEKIGGLENPGFSPSVADISADGKNVFVGGKVVCLDSIVELFR